MPFNMTPEKRALIAERNEALAVLETMGGTGAEVPADRQQEFDAAAAAFDKAQARLSQIEAIESRAAQAAEYGTPEAAAQEPAAESDEQRAALALTGFRNYLRGRTDLTTAAEHRALSDSVATEGGFTVPGVTLPELIQAVDNATFVRQYARIIPVNGAESLGAASLDADPANYDWTSEIASVSADSTMAFGKRELKPHLLTKLVKVSHQLLKSSAVNIEQLVLERLGYIQGVTQEQAFLTGSGSNQPLGVYTASASGISTGRDVLTGSATDWTADQVKACVMTLKQQYHGRARWNMHRDGLLKIQQLKDSNNNYLHHQPQDKPLMFVAGFPVDLSEYAPNTFTTGQYVATLGDWNAGYWIAEDRAGASVQRLDEKYADTNQVGFIGRGWTDGMPVLEEAFVRAKTS
jgi:HK97 family phage major capsid protein